MSSALDILLSKLLEGVVPKKMAGLNLRKYRTPFIRLPPLIQPFLITTSTWPFAESEDTK